MSKKNHVALLAVLFSLVLGLLLPVSLPAQLEKICCVAGTYDGFQIPFSKPNCPPPTKQTFTMIVEQGKPCTADIQGKITDSAGVVSGWTGTLRPATRPDCCLIEGSFLTPSGNTVVFKGTICLKRGKWEAKGTWEERKASDPCKGGGTWEMSQV